MKKTKIAILISGRGSNMEVLVKACAKKSFPAEVVLVLSNRPKAGGLKFAKSKGICTSVIDHTAFEDRDSFEHALHEALKQADVSLICLAGFMRVLNAGFVNQWRARILNIHPSLLPSFKGLHTHQRVLEAGVRFTGCTVHFVRPEMDSGPIISQAVVPIEARDTPETIAAKVLKLEHRIYPEAVRLVAEGRVKVTGNTVQIDGQKKLKGRIINPPLN